MGWLLWSNNTNTHSDLGFEYFCFLPKTFEVASAMALALLHSELGFGRNLRRRKLQGKWPQSKANACRLFQSFQTRLIQQYNSPRKPHELLNPYAQLSFFANFFITCRRSARYNRWEWFPFGGLQTKAATLKSCCVPPIYKARPR